MSTKNLQITGIENRGTADCPYGFVYFEDGSRVGYAPGVEVDNPNEFNAFAYVGPHWVPATAAHVRAAIKALREAGIKDA